MIFCEIATHEFIATATKEKTPQFSIPAIAFVYNDEASWISHYLGMYSTPQLSEACARIWSSAPACLGQRLTDPSPDTDGGAI